MRLSSAIIRFAFLLEEGEEPPSRQEVVYAAACTAIGFVLAVILCVLLG